MSEKEKKILETIAKAVKASSERKKDYFLGWAEGAAAMADSVTQEDAEKTPA